MKLGTKWFTNGDIINYQQDLLPSIRMKEIYIKR